MNSGLQKRLYEMEVPPPASVWDKLSANIDEINADNLLGKKILGTELTPPASAWQNISTAINPEEKKEQTKRGLVVNFKRLAAAAIVIGIIVTAWLIFINDKGNDTLAGVQIPGEKNGTNEKDPTTKKTENTEFIDSSIERDNPVRQLDPGPATSTDNKIAISSNRPQNRNNIPKSRNKLIAQSTATQPASLNEPLSKSFNEPIDDLSLVTSDQNYLTMVNANGRLVKIPAQFANLAPHLQNKPVSEDYYEIMFGEGAYWKETLNEWRKKVASLPVSSGDAFTSFIELLKTVQDK